ncbi:Tyrosyl-DNA phosphodiesterase 1 [Neolecta irregularis DAH-3]|uniref:Tyrosyl-DNA phosphodiesterase 1 n=1 Tax=Neolecta irregularis (strain DAH-3) TaxID=1198029 RepID=A0A1U7LTA2_NEOID|nr:Tyrosyl-DNA phosphodiesterase 1 [Neolecta irregularis DAH-3]|eukprot:OLL25772.1 Tyrosyl-DNA phosphodiesterase 1 [Neolecta irregularis DAH-3]
MSHKVIDLTEDDSFADESHYSQLQRALALSLKDSKRNPVEEVLDDADPDLKEALRLSVVSQQTSRIDSPAESENHTTHENLTEEPAIRNFCGFDRRFMEQERLARLKRKHSATCIRLSVSPESKRTKALTSAAALITTTSCSGDEAQYLNGVIKLTHVNGYVKKEEHISIEEVFQKDSLQAAVLSSFVIDHEWVFSKLNIGSYPIVLVQHSGSITDSTQARQIPEQLPKVSVVFPPMGKARCMHSKLQLLFHIEFLRVVIPTANLIPQDWGEIGAMENECIDSRFNYLLTRASITTSSRFGDDLLYFCEASKYPENVRQKIKEFNFSGARVGILHSIGGEHFGSDSVRMTGFPLLAETVQRMGLQNTQVKLDYVVREQPAESSNFRLHRWVH